MSAGASTWTALAYLLCREKGRQLAMEGRAVEVDGGAATVVDLPFLSRDFAPGAAPLQSPASPSPAAPRCAAVLLASLSRLFAS